VNLRVNLTGIREKEREGAQWLGKPSPLLFAFFAANHRFKNCSGAL
jgi:hypothetical protein